MVANRGRVGREEIYGGNWRVSNKGDILYHILGVCGISGTPGGWGGRPPPPLLEHALHPIIFLLCGTATRNIIITPLLIPHPLLTTSDGASVVSSIGQRGPPLGIDELCRKSKIIRGVLIHPHPEGGGRSGGWIFRYTLCVPHLPWVSWRYLVLVQFHSQTPALNTASLHLLTPLLSPIHIFMSSLLHPPQIRIWFRIGVGLHYGSSGVGRSNVCNLPYLLYPIDAPSSTPQGLRQNPRSFLTTPNWRVGW